ncbi:MAG TPA: MBL fold metallo-hydrolase [Acidobacteriota bacterium]|nr:MBL fold metallo-hydrolase [Acidobacteriota bacterium]
MQNRETDFRTWRGTSLNVRVLFSAAGVAQHIWLSNRTGALLVDTGDGALRDILSGGLDLESLRGILFTHGHFDHMGGLHSLLGFLRMVGRTDAVPIYAPAGCVEVPRAVDLFRRCYHGTVPFSINYRELQPGSCLQIVGMSIVAYPVVHCGSIEGSDALEPVPALGYRITCEGDTVAITGDTGNCPGLKELVRGADFAILEATYEKSTDVDRESLEKVHLSEDVAREIGRLAREFILVHKAPRPG